MARTSYKTVQVDAELLVSSLLAYVTNTINEPKGQKILIQCEPDTDIRVKAEPAHLARLIDIFLASLSSLSSDQQNFHELTITEKSKKLKNTIQCLIELGIAKDKREERDNTTKRHFVITFPHNPLNYQNVSANLAWLGDRCKNPSHELKKQAELKNLDKTYCHAMVAAAKLFPTSLNDYTQERLKSLEPLIPFIQKATNIDGYTPEDFAILIQRIVRFCIAQGKFSDAHALLNQCQKRLNGTNSASPAIAENYHYLGVVHFERGEYKQAEEFLIQAIALRKQIFGNCHLDVIASTLTLTDIYIDSEQFRKAKKLVLESIQTLQSEYGERHSEVANTKIKLAILHDKRGNYIKAESLCNQAIDIISEAYGQQHAYMVNAHIELAHLYAKQKKYTEAHSCYERAITFTKKIHGENHLTLAIAQASLAGVCYYQGDSQTAKSLYSRAIQLVVKLYGNTHPLVADYSCDLAMILIQEPKQRQFAKKLLLKTIQILQGMKPYRLTLEKARHGLEILQRTDELHQENT
ncbi:hypothetical protein NIES2100_65190 [Calothrix sp. NIES-2100]|uniref:tetratricopeptide repeat protein n=1 Tax=Calothrix sp. NIES-2100 TaxID=1954172 RepID=UPI000B5ECED8|nr:hypothetical protein NIES2100_65190 [Calothrix sp. NIES-2100]